MSRLLITIGLALTLSLTLSACREEEQGRKLRFEKGTYLGKPDTPLSDETLRALRGRAQQGTIPGIGGVGGSSGGAAPAQPSVPAGATVRKPVSPQIDERELRSRAGSQRF